MGVQINSRTDRILTCVFIFKSNCNSSLVERVHSAEAVNVFEWFCSGKLSSESTHRKCMFKSTGRGQKVSTKSQSISPCSGTMVRALITL